MKKKYRNLLIIIPVVVLIIIIAIFIIANDVNIEIKKDVKDINENEISTENIEVTTENILDYISIQVDISNFDYKLIDTFIANEYLATADLKIRIIPTKKVNFENVKISVDLGLIGYASGLFNNIQLDSKGNYTETRIIEYDCTGMIPFKPVYYPINMKVTEANGTIIR